MFVIIDANITAGVFGWRDIVTVSPAVIISVLLSFFVLEFCQGEIAGYKDATNNTAMLMLNARMRL